MTTLFSISVAAAARRLPIARRGPFCRRIRRSCPQYGPCCQPRRDRGRAVATGSATAMPIICPYSCYIGLHFTISTYTGFATLATPRFRYRCSAVLTLKMKKTAVTLSHVHTNIRHIWRTIDVERCGFKPCRC